MMDITDMFRIPLLRNLTLKMRGESLDKFEYTIEKHPKGGTIVHQGTTCNALHVLLEGELNVDVLDVPDNTVRVKTIQAPCMFATPHILSEKNQFPAILAVGEDVVLLKGAKGSVFISMYSISLFLHNFPRVSTSCNRHMMTRLKVLSFRSTRNHFIYYLLEHQQKGSDTVELEHTQEQLAGYFGITHSALLKEIGRLVDGGFISIIRRRVTISSKTTSAYVL